ncbi:MAG: phosphate/phosphite/phosphonate ABC transporter substrate-binding protein [Nitrospirota bacterium]
MGFVRTVVSFGILCAAAVGCSHPDAGYRPETLRIGVMPNAAPEVLRRQHGPLVAYLQRETGLEAELVIPKDGDELLEMFRNRRVDMAYLGGYPYLIARERDQAVPLVTRDADLYYTSLIIVPANSAARRFEDLRGARFGFVRSPSTAGYFMPRYFLSEKGMETERFFGEIMYSDVYDTTAMRLRKGQIDAGVVSREAFERLLAAGQITKRDGRVVWETPPFADSVWAVQRDLAPSVQAEIQDRMLALAPDEPESRAVLEAAGATYFLLANDADYNALRQSVAADRTRPAEG